MINTSFYYTFILVFQTSDVLYKETHINNNKMVPVKSYFSFNKRIMIFLDILLFTTVRKTIQTWFEYQSVFLVHAN